MGRNRRTAERHLAARRAIVRFLAIWPKAPAPIRDGRDRVEVVSSDPEADAERIFAALSAGRFGGL